MRSKQIFLETCGKLYLNRSELRRFICINKNRKFKVEQYTYVRRYSKNSKIVVFIGIFTSMFFYTLDAWNE